MRTISSLRSAATCVAAVTGAAIVVALAAGCSLDYGSSSVAEPDPDPQDAVSPEGGESLTVPVRDTELAVEIRGEGAPLLVIHGGGEDSSMLAPQAASLASAGFRVITYDRRGTGGSGRESWPGDGATQHADDAAALLETLADGPATVVGVSSGGVIAMALASRHPQAVERVVAWEPPALGVLPGGKEMGAALMAPIEDFLEAHPGDFVGAQAMLLTQVLGFPVSVDDPAFAGARANAEAMIRDEPKIPEHPFTADDLGGVDLTVAVGDEPNDLVAAAAAALAELTGRPTTQATGPHEVYMQDPQVLTDVVLAAATDG
jgi:pimeloyl-ACP methyl ester carboxylesterase